MAAWRRWIPESRTHRVRATNRLSAVWVAKVKEPGLYEDGGGLRLILTEKGVKRWALRFTIHGRRVERGLGLWPTVSLVEARRKADQFLRERILVPVRPIRLLALPPSPICRYGHDRPIRLHPYVGNREQEHYGPKNTL